MSRWEQATFANGDRCTGEPVKEGGKIWYPAIDSNGDPYETEEQPAIRLNLTLVRLPEGTPEHEARQMLADLRAEQRALALHTHR